MGMETKIADKLQNRDFIQARMTTQVMKGLRVLKYLNRDQVGDDVANYVYFEEQATPEEDLASGKMKASEKIAPGAELQIVRTSDLKATPVPLETRGFKLVLEYNKLQQNGMSVLRYISRLAYAQGKELERDAINALLQGNAPVANITEQWSTSANINKDIRARKTAFYDDSLGMELNTFLYDKVNHAELCDFKEAVEGKNYDFPSFQDGEDIHEYGGSLMTHGTSIGFDRNEPPATVAYAVNPRAFNPQVMKGMEAYAPYINVKVKEVFDEDPEKLIIFMRMTTTSVLEEKRGSQVQSGL